MMEINRHTLPNGLRLIHNFDSTTQMVAVNTLYDVGARDEAAHRTGFAHLFEHLMFGGSLHIPDFDAPLQEVGGENNAWTNNDITNYYTVVPRHQIETALWLESDRMLALDFSEKQLNVQRQVVIEEFKQRYINQPYGDMSHLLRAIAYQKHPYRWPTIGKEISHIEQATLAEVKSFFYSHYAPNNAILSIVGNISWEETLHYVTKWYGDIAPRQIAVRRLPQEPTQQSPRFIEVTRPVPQDAIVKCYHMCARREADYHCYDALSDLLASGRSSRLFRRLVMGNPLFSEVDAYISGDIDAGLFYISGKPIAGVSLEEADKALTAELTELATIPVSDDELQKIINRFESQDIFSNISYLNRATNMAYHELLDRAENINTERDKYLLLNPLKLQKVAQACFTPTNCSTLYYHATLK